MTDYVIDASVAVEYLLKTPIGLAMADTIESGSLVAPELIDAEVLSTLRREVLGGRLEEVRAREAIDDLLCVAHRTHISPLPCAVGLGALPKHQRL